MGKPTREGSSSSRVDFTPDEVQGILDFARKVVEGTVRHERMTPYLPKAIAETPTSGLFVALKHGPRLRSRLGVWAEDMRPLEEVLHQAARDAACPDPRYPCFRKDELPYLNLEIHLLYDLQPMTAQGAERVKAFQAGEHGLVVSAGRARALFLPQLAQEHRWDEELFLRRACRKAGLEPEAWQRAEVRILTFRVHTLYSEAQASSEEDETGIRPAARAGQFYPENPAEMNARVHHYLSRSGTGYQKPRRAVMLPHAGWMYCGETIGKTLASTTVPETVIIVGPKHTPYGAPWSVPPHHHWQIPGAKVPIATELIDDLLNLVPELECEEGAHRMEHGSEVLLPFLAALNPNVRVLPVVLGDMDYAQTTSFAAALGELLGERKEPILLVISSDLNHFAPEAENRRLDRLALDAMLSGEAQALYETVSENDISMCGMIPAVTVMQTLRINGRRPAPEELKLELVDYRTSAQASGDASSVVGYAGVVIE